MFGVFYQFYGFAMVGPDVLMTVYYKINILGKTKEQNMTEHTSDWSIKLEAGRKIGREGRGW